MRKHEEALFARTKAFHEEFPFMYRYTSVRWHEKRPVVQRVDLDLMDQGPYERHPMDGHYRYILIGDDGQELGEARREQKIRDVPFNPFKLSTYGVRTVEAQTVLEAIRDIDNPDDIRYVLELNDRYHTLRGRREDIDCGVVAILYKVPADWKFSDWTKDLRVHAQAELKSEITSVDNV